MLVYIKLQWLRKTINKRLQFMDGLHHRYAKLVSRSGDVIPPLLRTDLGRRLVPALVPGRPRGPPDHRSIRLNVSELVPVIYEQFVAAYSEVVHVRTSSLCAVMCKCSHISISSPYPSEMLLCQFVAPAS